MSRSDRVKRARQRPPGGDWHDHPECAPRDTMPTTFWGPERLDGVAFRELLPLCFLGNETAALERALDGMTTIVDVGGGTGAVTQALSPRAQIVVIEPDAEQRAHVPTSIEVRDGRAEYVPVGDGEVDAAMATWILQYTDDPFRAIGELARIAKHRVAIVQAAPNNDLVEIYNREAAIAGLPRAHHGWLLAEAATRLEDAGFLVELEHVAIGISEPPGGHAALADILVRLHFADHPERSRMVAATSPYIAERFAAEYDPFCDDAILLLARR